MSRPPRPELLALLADVKENPDDLTPWLVLTDWLEENGDEADCARAEYCRLCFDKLGKKTYASDWEKGERRRELFRDYADQWFGGLMKLFGVQEFGYQRGRMKRGLLQVSSSAVDLLQINDDEVPAEAGSWIEQLEVYNLSSYLLDELAHRTLLEGPAIVKLSCRYDEQLSASALHALARSPYLNQVRELEVTGKVSSDRRKALAPLRRRFGKAFHSRLS